MLESILLVEDNPDDVHLLKMALGKVWSGDLLQTVRDGQEALDYFSGQGDYNDREAYPLPRLVLLDLRLPKVSGLEVLQWIRSKPELDEVVVVVLTCSDQPSEITQAYHAGANSVLSKPSNPNDTSQLIKAVIDYWLGKKRFDASAASRSQP
jgi:CheY-like chemotaxis protein